MGEGGPDGFIEHAPIDIEIVAVEVLPLRWRDPAKVGIAFRANVYAGDVDHERAPREALARLKVKHPARARSHRQTDPQLRRQARRPGCAGGVDEGAAGDALARGE